MIIRPARPDEIPALERLIAASARQLSIGFYSPQETEAAIKHVFGVDSELVGDGTYLVVELDGRIAGCGGWSRRATLFGSDRFAQRQIGFVDPAQAPAKIRAFFIAPEFARRGVGAALLDACEAAARAADFTQAELMATLPRAAARVPTQIRISQSPGRRYPLRNADTRRIAPKLLCKPPYMAAISA